MSDIPSSENTDTFLIRPEFKKKAIRSYVIRAGRITLGQKTAFDDWWPKLGLSLHKGAMNPAEIFAREAPLRSEERRVGKECRSRWWTDHSKTNERTDVV